MEVIRSVRTALQVSPMLALLAAALAVFVYMTQVRRMPR